jgi:hypothetical protein
MGGSLIDFKRMSLRLQMRELDLPGFTTAMDGGSAGAAGSGSSKNLEGLHSVLSGCRGSVMQNKKLFGSRSVL